MNRRTFLKSIAAVCGAAVVCPGELLKSELNLSPYERWRNYYTTYKPPVNTKLLDELAYAIKNTKFHPPFRILRK